MELMAKTLSCEWNSEAEIWMIMPDEQHNENEKQPKTKPPQIKSIPEDQPTKDEPEQPVIEAEQETEVLESKPKARQKRKPETEPLENVPEAKPTNKARRTK